MNRDPSQSTDIVLYVGTHKLAAFAGCIENGESRILAHKEIFRPEGFENGLVTSLEGAVASLDKLLNDLLPRRGTRDVKTYVVLGNDKLSAYNFSSAQYYASRRSLTNREVRAVIDQTRSVATLPLTQHVLQVVPESFLVNDMEGVLNPLGLEATRLGVNLKIFTMDYHEFRNLEKAFEAIDITVLGYWPRMLTVSEAVLSRQEKEEGVVLIDVADHIAQIILWKNGRLVQARSIERGGKYLTRCIASEWGIESHDAEKVKERFGTLESGMDFADELIPLVKRNGRDHHQIRRQEFQEKFLEMAGEWLQSILEEADRAARDEKLAYPHYVFSGGGTSFSGFLEFLQRQFGREARMGLGRKIDGPQEVLVDPSLTAAHGMYRWLGNYWREYQMLVAPQGFLEKTLASAKSWFYTYF